MCSASIDHNANEPIASDLLVKLISSPAIYHLPENIDIPFDQIEDSVDIDRELLAIKERCSIVLRPISRLELVYKVPEIIRLVNGIKRHQKTKQLFVWCSVASIMEKRLIPFIAYMADIVVTLKADRHLTVMTKRSTGSASMRVISSGYQ